MMLLPSVRCCSICLISSCVCSPDVSFSTRSLSAKRTLVISIFSERFMRRPPESRIACQLSKGSLISRYGGSVCRVLSHARILMVVSATSSTTPSMPYLDIAIQSPTLSILLADSCTPATSPRMLSLNMSISTAAEAPIPVRSIVGERSSIMARTSIIAMQAIITYPVCARPLSGLPCQVGRCSMRSKLALTRAKPKRVQAITRYISVTRLSIVYIQSILPSSGINAMGSNTYISIGVIILHIRLTTIRFSSVSSHFAFV